MASLVFAKVMVFFTFGGLATSPRGLGMRGAMAVNEALQLGEESMSLKYTATDINIMPTV